MRIGRRESWIMHYKAFMSYSHAADGKLAPALQSAIHRFAKPWYRLRAIHVFRDKTSLSVNPALWPSIEKALSESEYFILLASPQAAKSRWVKQEIDHWLRNRSVDKILIVLTDGELVWDSAIGDFDWNKTTAIPANLQNFFTDEPLFLDLRRAKIEEPLSLSNPKFRESIAELAAPLHGRPKDEIIGEDVRQHRRTKQLTWSAVITLLTLTLFSVVAAYLAVQRGNLADERARIAEERRRIAMAFSLVKQLEAIKTRFPIRALLLAVEANNVLKDSDLKLGTVQTALREALKACNGQGIATHTGTVRISPDLKWLVTKNDNGEPLLWDIAASDPFVTPVVLEGHAQAVISFVFALDSRKLATVSEDGAVRIWDLSSKAPSKSSKLLAQIDQSIRIVGFSGNGRWLVTYSRGNLHLRDLLGSNSAEKEIRLAENVKPRSLFLRGEDNRWLIASIRDQRSRVWDLHHGDPVNSVVFLEEKAGTLLSAF